MLLFFVSSYYLKRFIRFFIQSPLIATSFAPLLPGTLLRGEGFPTPRSLALFLFERRIGFDFYPVGHTTFEVTRSHPDQPQSLEPVHGKL